MCTPNVPYPSRYKAEKRSRQIRPLSILFPHTLPKLELQVEESLYSSPSHEKMVCVCMRGRDEVPLYSGGGRVGATPRDPLYGNLISLG